MEFTIFLLLLIGFIPVKLDIPTKKKVYKIPAHVFCNLVILALVVLGGI